MTIKAAVGTLGGISADTPASGSAADFAALDYQMIGKIGSIPQFGRMYGKAEFKASLGSAEKDKGGHDEGSASMTVAVDEDDIGQMALIEAADDRGAFCFMFVTPGGATRFCRALVMAWTPVFGGRDDTITAEIPLELTHSAVVAAESVPLGATANFLFPDNLPLAGAI